RHVHRGLPRRRRTLHREGVSMIVVSRAVPLRRARRARTSLAVVLASLGSALLWPGSLLGQSSSDQTGKSSGPIIDVEKAPDRRIAVGIGKYDDVPASEVGSPPGEVVAFDLDLAGWFQP